VELCEACKAVVDRVHKELKRTGRKRKQVNLLSIYENVCKEDDLRIYKEIPPTMAKACNIFKEEHDETIEKMISRTDLKDSNYEDQADRACTGKGARPFAAAAFSLAARFFFFWLLVCPRCCLPPNPADAVARQARALNVWWRCATTGRRRAARPSAPAGACCW